MVLISYVREYSSVSVCWFFILYRVEGATDCILHIIFHLLSHCFDFVASIIFEIFTHVIGFKIRNVRKFLDNKNRVKVTVFFRGREMAHQDLGVQLLNKVKEDTLDIAKVESEPRLEGRQMVMVLGPKKGK